MFSDSGCSQIVRVHLRMHQSPRRVLSPDDNMAVCAKQPKAVTRRQKTPPWSALGIAGDNLHVFIVNVLRRLRCSPPSVGPAVAKTGGLWGQSAWSPRKPQARRLQHKASSSATVRTVALILLLLMAAIAIAAITPSMKPVYDALSNPWRRTAEAAQGNPGSMPPIATAGPAIRP